MPGRFAFLVEDRDQGQQLGQHDHERCVDLRLFHAFATHGHGHQGRREQRNQRQQDQQEPGGFLPAILEQGLQAVALNQPLGRDEAEAAQSGHQGAQGGHRDPFAQHDAAAAHGVGEQGL